MQIGAFALEERMCAEGEKNVEVAGGATAHARFAFTGKPDAGAVLDPCRNAHRQGTLARYSSGAGTGRTRVVDHLTAALAGRTGPLQGEKSLSMANAPLTTASRTSLGSCAGLGTRAGAGLARHRGRDAHLGALTGVGFLQSDLHVVAQVGTAFAAAGASTATAAHTEQIIEDIGEGRGYVAKATSGSGTGMLECGMTKAVISRTLVRIFEDLIGLVDLFEAVFAALVAGIAIGMPLHRELAKGGLQFTFVRGALDP